MPIDPTIEPPMTEPAGTGIIAYGADFKPRARRSPYANSALIVQLLATYDQHPQWRTHRRIDGQTAARAYTACAHDMPSQAKNGAQI